jgi:two-component system, cell cycle response regulator
LFDPAPLKANVLLVNSDSNESALYLDLIREVFDPNIDVLSHLAESSDWVMQAHYQVVIIDLGSIVDSEHSGLSFLEKIKQLSPATGVILIATKPNVEQAVSAVKIGAEDYLQKPVDPHKFKIALQRALDKSRAVEQGEASARILSLLNCCQLVSSSVQEERILRILKNYFSGEVQSKTFGFYRVIPSEDQKGELEVKPLEVGVEERGADPAMGEVLDIAMNASDPFKIMTQADEFYRFVDRTQLMPGLFVFRFRCSGVGETFLVALSPQKPESLPSFENRLRILIAQLEETGRQIQKYRGFRDLIYVDEVTGLHNTRYLNVFLDRLFTEAEEKGGKFAILFIDADHFKKINDTYGHIIGSRLLKELGKLLRKQVRASDQLFRYGGDEFVAVLTPSDLETAQAVAERIRKTVEESGFLGEEGPALKFTVSIGIALFPNHARTKKEVMDMADQAMYAAKSASRNCVFVARSQGQLK